MACIKGGVAPMKESVIVQIFLPEWAKIAFLRFWKSNFSRGINAPGPPVSDRWNVINAKQLTNSARSLKKKKPAQVN